MGAKKGCVSCYQSTGPTHPGWSEKRKVLWPTRAPPARASRACPGRNMVHATTAHKGHSDTFLAWHITMALPPPLTVSLKPTLSRLPISMNIPAHCPHCCCQPQRSPPPPRPMACLPICPSECILKPACLRLSQESQPPAQCFQSPRASLPCSHTAVFNLLSTLQPK